MIWKISILMIGVFGCSTAVIIIKASTTEPVTLTAARLLGASILLLPLYLRARKRTPKAIMRRKARRAFIPGVTLALHFATWIYGARLTPAANSSLVVNLVPLAILILNEKPFKMEYVATAIAMLGLAILGIGDLDLSPEYLLGDAICFGSMILLAFYLALARRGLADGDMWAYLVPVYAIAGVTAAVAAIVMGRLDIPDTAKEWYLIAGLAIVPTIIGHSALNYSMRILRAQLVSIVNMTQFVFSGIMGYLFFKEVPASTFAVALVFIIPACVIAVRESARHNRALSTPTKSRPK